LLSTITVNLRSLAIAPLQQFHARNVFEITDDEARSAEFMTGTAAQNHGTVRDHGEIGMIHRVVATIIHAEAKRLRVGFANQLAQFILLHVVKMANESNCVNVAVLASMAAIQNRYARSRCALRRLP
ncbi:MAG TPA: hypothetical protein VK530_08215, partial [Candidatus Acidoferrum sp.]|nr:hypothetical protein [Candidatus Acidoferrum sp.]